MSSSKNFMRGYLSTWHRKTTVIAMTSLLLSTALITSAPVASADTASISTCVNITTGAMRLLSKGICIKKLEKKVAWSRIGPKGATGAIGPSGLAGANGPSGATGLAGSNGLAGVAGVNGSTILQGTGTLTNDMGNNGDYYFNTSLKIIYGPKANGSWPSGVSLAGSNGGPGAAGTNGINGTNGATGPAGSNGSNGFVSQSICGAGGTTLCTIGAQGPGGGLIFFVDYNNQYSGFNYLEAAPVSCEASKEWSSDTGHSLTAVTGWAGRAVGAGQANTNAMLADGAVSYLADTSRAAFYAHSCSAGSKTDWFLGSIGEMKLMYDNLQGLGGFGSVGYWSSTESTATTGWLQYFDDGTQGSLAKTSSRYVRPVRAF